MQKINGGALCHSMNATQWLRDPTMNSSDLPFETLIKPCVSEVRHLGIQCRRGCSGIPSYGFHKILRFPPNPQKSFSKCKFPHNLQAPIDQAAGRDRQPGAPRHVRTYMFSVSFPTKPLGINRDLQSHIVSPNNDSQVRFELDGTGYGGSGRKESTKSLVQRCGKLIKSDLICDKHPLILAV